MTNEQINVAIAEACGWADITRIASNGWLHKKLVGTHKGMKVTFDVHTPIPDYCNDLNSMHEAETQLWAKSYGARYDFVHELGKILLPTIGYRAEAVDLLDATARQRAEAFLRTLDKWEEAK